MIDDFTVTFKYSILIIFKYQITGTMDVLIFEISAKYDIFGNTFVALRKMHRCKSTSIK